MNLPAKVQGTNSRGKLVEQKDRVPKSRARSIQQRAPNSTGVVREIGMR